MGHVTKTILVPTSRIRVRERGLVLRTLRKQNKSAENNVSDILYGLRPHLVIAFCIGFFTNLLLLVVPIYMLQVYDRVLRNESFETLTYLTLIAVISVVFIGILDISKSLLINKAISATSRRLRRYLTGRSVEKRPEEKKLLKEANLHASRLHASLSGQSLLTLLDAFWAPLFVFAIWLLHPHLAFFAVVIIAILVGLSFAQNVVTAEQMRKLNRKQQEAERYRFAVAQESDITETLGISHPLNQLWDRSDRNATHLNQVISHRSQVVASLSKAIRMAAQIGVVCLGATLVLINELSAGGIIAGSILLARALLPFEQLIGAWQTTATAYASLQSLLTVGSKLGVSHHIDEFPKPEGRITVKGVTYRPVAQRSSILQGIQFTMQPGKCVGIIGPAGSGKTAIARLMLGLEQPTTGEIVLDDVSLSNWHKPALGKYIGYQSQRLEFAPGSIAENISRFSDAPLETVIEIAKSVGAHAAIAQLPEGYDTLLDDDTHALSAGLKQQISLARAFFGNPSLIVLDEPTNNLDGAAETFLTHAIADAKQRGAAVAIFTHRRNALASADNLLVLQQGRLIDQGPPEDVLKRLPANQNLRPFENQRNNRLQSRG